MMLTDRTVLCAVELGHAEPVRAEWRCHKTNLCVCTRHRRQYEERPDLGPFDWRQL